jgi:hypothetical protein
MPLPADLKKNLKPELLSPPWPRLHDAALYGPMGEFVKAAAQHTEADQAAILGSVLAGCGTAMGGRLLIRAGNSIHCTCLYVGIIGRSAKARKGTSSKPVEAALSIYDNQWDRGVFNGFGSGVALITKLAEVPNMLVMETELTRVLKVGHREGDDTGQVFRMAWDHDKLMNVTRKNGTVEIGKNKYHLGCLGHATMDELTKTFSTADIYGGTVNRILWFCASRSQVLSDGGQVPHEILRHFADGVLRAAESLHKHIHRPSYYDADKCVAGPPDEPDPDLQPETPQEDAEENAIRRRPPVMEPNESLWASRSPQAEQLWKRLFGQVASDDPHGMLGEAIARGEAQFLRLSLLYAAMDGTPVIKTQHVNAAYAVWQYCRASAAYLFRTTTGNHRADKLYNYLQERGPIARGQVMDKVFGTHDLAPGEVEECIAALTTAGLLLVKKEATGGRPVEYLSPLFPLSPARLGEQSASGAAPSETGDKGNKGGKARRIVRTPDPGSKDAHRLAQPLVT